MIDLHCHMLPGMDDGAASMEVALEMARMAVGDGIVTTACTPHITPGVYNNKGEAIREAIETFRSALDDAGIPLTVTTGADAHLDPDMIPHLRSGRIPTLAQSRYFLLEPPHHSAPPKLEAFTFTLMTSGYVPILTHPERLRWIDGHFDMIDRLWAAGVLMQITSSSILGRFGHRAQRWAETMLDKGMVDLVASDGHNCDTRPPLMSAARDAVAQRWGDAAAVRLVATNPLAILQNVLPSKLRQPSGSAEERPG